MRGIRKQLQELNATVVVVQRDDKLKGEGLKRTANKTKVDFVLLDDHGGKATSPYSQGSFTTYIIDKNGFIRFILDGTKTKRPAAAKVVARLRELKEK